MKNSISNIFDSSRIFKYYKDQQPAVNLTKQFTDPVFPPNDFSLLAKDIKGNWIGDDTHKEAIDNSNVVWKNAHEIFGEAYNLFDDKIECDDVKQGSLGNCYFLSSLASLCEFPYLIYNIFRTKEKSQFGYYEVLLFIEGEWQIVILDDYFPVCANNNKLFKFSKPNGNELWAILLEKAWAKVNGGYRNTISGKENEALNALTGFPAERYDTRSCVMSKDELWALVLQSDKSSNVMCTTTITDPKIKDVGLVALHAYTLVGAVIVKYDGVEERLVKIRNPWGNTEWNGKWSDKSEVWTNDLKKQADVKDENDGIFHMSLDDYQTYYCFISICAIMPESNVKTFKFPVSAKNSSPKVYNIHLRNDSVLALGAIDRHFRFSREIKNGSIPLFIVLARYENHDLQFIDADMSFNTSVDLIKDLKAGNYLFWVWNDFNHSDNIFEKDGKTKYIKIILTSNDKFYAKEQANDENFSLLKRVIFNEVIKGKDIKSPIYTAVENMFKKSGIGYRLIVNNQKDSASLWSNDPSGLLEMNMFPPFKNENFEITVNPGDWDFFLASRKSLYGKYWFNIKSTYKPVSVDKDKLIIHNNNQDFYSIFCDESVGTEEINANFYDYCSPKLSNDQPNFKQEDLSQLQLEDLKKKFSTEMELLLKFEENPCEKKDEVKWDYIKFENGYYVGQLNTLNQRHGRGIYIFSNKTGYYGHWVSNVKSGKGISFSAGFAKTYEGEFSNNQQHGKGMFYFSNGDIIDATYENGVRNGPGIYYWAGGNKWEGAFKNNQLHGTGPYTTKDGSTFIITFENGKQKQ